MTFLENNHSVNEIALFSLSNENVKKAIKFKQLYYQWIEKNKSDDKHKSFVQNAIIDLVDDNYNTVEWVVSVQEASKLYNIYRRQKPHNKFHQVVYQKMILPVINSDFNYVESDEKLDGCLKNVKHSILANMHSFFYRDISNKYIDISSDELIGNQIFNVFTNASNIAYYRFFELTGLVKYPKNVSKILRLYERFVRGCQSIYIINDHIIIVKKQPFNSLQKCMLIV